MNEDFAKLMEDTPALFLILAASDPISEKWGKPLKGKAGVYAFYENGFPVHVGRTRNLLRRLRGHVVGNHFSATFAFKRARRALKLVATYRTKGSRGELMKDSIFRPEFDRQLATVRTMAVRFVEVSNPAAQYLLELYAHLEWNLPLDEFDTH